MSDPSPKMQTYGQLSTELYDLNKPKPPDFVWEFYLDHAKKISGPILEPMCGSGRYLLPLLDEGFDVTGVDASPEMLAACQRRCLAKEYKPNLYQQYLHEMSLPKQYALVFIPAASFGLIIDDEAVQASLQRIYEAMLPGAKFIVEFETPWSKPHAFGRWFGYWEERPDGAKIVFSNLDRSYDENKNILQSLAKYELVKDGQLTKTEFEFLNTRFYEPQTFIQLLNNAGFVDIQCQKAWGGFSEQPPGPEDPRAVAICYRPA